jgi:hypothetical protein
MEDYKPITNNDRADRAGRLITAYEPGSADLSDESVVGDLIADIMHFCDKWALDFQTALTSAHNHHDEEVSDEAAE